MSKTCLVCKAHHLEMISIFRHPEKLNSMLMLHWGLQASKDDSICRGCCDEVLSAFDLNPKCQLPTLNDQMNSLDPTEMVILPMYEKVKSEPRSDDDFESKPKISIVKPEAKTLGENVEETSEAIAGEFPIKIENLGTSSGQNGGESSIDYEQYYKSEIPFDVGDSDEMKENPFAFAENRMRSSKATKLQTKQKNYTGERPYECPLCSKTFITSTRLKEHKRTHTGERPFVCSYCSKTYITAASLHIHVRTHMVEKPFVCSECGKSCTTSQLLKYHKRTHTGERPYTCSYCPKSYIAKGRLQRHLSSHSKEKHKGPFECLQCSKTFKSSWAHKVHIRMHVQEINASDSRQNSTESNIHKPKVQSGKAAISNDTIDHIDRSVDSKAKVKSQNNDESVEPEAKKLPEQLPTSLKKSLSFSGQTEDERNETRPKSFKRYRSFDIRVSDDDCENNSGINKPIKDECSSEFMIQQQTRYDENLLEGLSQKLSIKTYKKEKPHSCVECGKCFPTTTKLEIHKRTHTGEKPYECALCEKTFVSSYKLTEHKRIHIGDKPYECRYCSKSFLRSTELQGHERIHTKEKPYHCSECGKDFVTASVLNRHKRIHTGVKPYACSHCSKTFTSKFYLQTHIRTHTKEDLFECSECGKCFTTSKLFKDHQMVHTGERPYSCSYCSKAYINRSGLINHTRGHTKETRKRKGPYECLRCSKTFRNSCAHKIHALTHTKKKNNIKSGTANPEENVDNMSFEIEDSDNDEEGESETQKKNHTGEKSYSCSYCSEIFHSSRNFRIHMRIHKKEQLYNCFECKKDFISLSDLNSHKKTHVKIKPYACSYCTKTYSTKSYVQKHMLIHTREEHNEEKPYECDQCSKTFEDGSTHKLHLLMHTEEISSVLNQPTPNRPEVLRDDGTVLNDKLGPVDQVETTIYSSDNDEALSGETEAT